MKASLYFNGSSYVQLPAIATSNVISVSAWIRTPNNIPSGSIDILGRSAGTSDLLEINTSGSLRFNVMTNVGPNSNVSRANILTKNKWHHVVGTYSVATATNKIYLDGVLVSTYTTPSGPLSNNANTWMIGALTSATRNFTGNICHVGIWNAELSASEIDSLYSNGTIPRQDLCVAYYPLEEGGGSSVYDKFNKATVGTITSATFTNDVPIATRQKVNPNLVRNGDFSYVPPFVAATTTSGNFIDGTSSGSSTNSLFGWALQFAGTMSAQFDKSNPYNGNASLKVSATATGTNAEVGVLPTNTAVNVSKFSIRLTPGAQYLCSFWMKTNYISGDSAGGAGMEFVERDSSGVAVVTNATTKIKTSTEWTKYTLTFTANATQTFLAPRMRVQGNTGAATLIMDAWFADIQVYPTTAVVRTATSSRWKLPFRAASSLYFNSAAATNNVTVTHRSQYTFNRNLTTSFWFKASKYMLDTAPLSKGIGSKNPFDWRWINTNGQLLFFCYDGTFQPGIGTKLVPGTWYHITGTRDGSTLKLYINGVLTASTTDTTVSDTDNTTDISFGKRTGGTQYFDGYLKDFKIWNRALTADEVFRLSASMQVPTQGLVGEWLLDEGSGSTAVDTSDYKNNGTITGAVYFPDAPISSRQKIVPQSKSSLYFDGSSKVNLPKTVPVSTGITYSAWIKPNGVANQRILGLNNNSSIRLDTNKKVLFVLYGIVEYPSNTTIEAGKWTHVAATYDKQNVKIYINGVLNSINAQTAAFPANGTLIEVGSYTGTAQFLGKITDCKIWTDKVLTSAEISDLYFNNKYSRNNLLVEYLFNEGAGSITTDTSDNKNNGTITGAAYTNDVPN